MEEKEVWPDFENKKPIELDLQKEEEPKQKPEEPVFDNVADNLIPLEERYDVLKIGHIQLSSKHYNIYQLSNLLLELLKQEDIKKVIEIIKKNSGSTGYLG